MLPVSFDALETPAVLDNAADVAVTATAADVVHPAAAAVPAAALLNCPIMLNKSELLA